MEILDGPPYTPDVDSEASFAWAREQLANCARDHASCGAGYVRKQTAVPRRLIDVNFHADHVRLVDSKMGLSDSHIRWCCLSYVWGGDQKLKTTKASLPAHQKHIALTSLPPTIRDAVIVCRQLDVPFLWVDSLCIVQDDDRDMKNELAVMGEFYFFAYATIIAACATDVNQGSFTIEATSILMHRLLQSSFVA